MDEDNSTEGTSFLNRLAMAFRVAFNSGFAHRVCDALQKAEAAATAAKVDVPPEKKHASALLLLQLLQREGRLVDFLQQDITGFPDEEVGTAARVVHNGCRKVLRDAFDLQSAMREAEGSQVSVPAGFDPRRVRLTGNVAGQPPFRGSLKHHGWISAAVRMPDVAESVDPKVIAPAEVELA